MNCGPEDTVTGTSKSALMDEYIRQIQFQTSDPEIDFILSHSDTSASDICISSESLGGF